MSKYKPGKRRIRGSIRYLILLMILILLICTFIKIGYWTYSTFFADVPIIKIFNDKNEEGNTNDSETKYKQLEDMIDKDSRIQTILNNYDSYPEDLLDRLRQNIDILDFVLEYPDKKENIYADSVGDITEGTIPLLLQWDERWGYGKYGDSIIAISGCAPTVLSMVISSLRNDPSITPYTIAKYAEENHLYVPGTGSSWDLITAGSQQFGISAIELTLSEDSIYTALEEGNPIICSMRPGDFTSTGHFIVLTQLQDGKIKVNDPNSIERSDQLWDYQTLASQISNLWVLSKI